MRFWIREYSRVEGGIGVEPGYDQSFEFEFSGASEVFREDTLFVVVTCEGDVNYLVARAAEEQPADAHNFRLPAGYVEKFYVMQGGKFGIKVNRELQ